MNASVVLLLCGVVGSVLAEYPARQAPYYVGPNQYSEIINPGYSREQSARLFWSNQGSNQVGGNGLWATLTNKFPILNNMFGRMELANDYGVPNTNYYQTGGYVYQPPQYQYQNYQQPQYQQNQYPYQQNQYPYQQNQYPYQQQQFFQQQVPAFRQRIVPLGRDVGFTDDAVIVTPPQVPIAPQPAPAQPSPAGGGYSYNKPQYRLDAPHK